jgi:hypothetical protein
MPARFAILGRVDMADIDEMQLDAKEFNFL